MLLVDLKTIAELKDLLGEDFAGLVDAFLADAAKHIELLEKLAPQGDAAAIERPAHALKGTSANIGAANLRDLASALVTQCRSGRVSNAEDSVRQIRAAFGQVVPLLTAQRDT